MRSTFEVLYENYLGRFTKGGFLPGDFVKFKPGILQNPSVAAGDTEYKAKIQQLLDSDVNLRISVLTNITGAESEDPNGTADQYNVSVYQTLPGNSASSTENLVTVPLSEVERVARSADETQVKVPDSFIRKLDNISHTNVHKPSADQQSDDYDSGKDFAGGSRDNRVEGTPEEFARDSDASGVLK